MWLWKKFKNTDIIGKIYILIILFIVIAATITVITRHKNANANQVVNAQQHEIIQETDISKQNIIVEDAIAVAEIDNNTETKSADNTRDLETKSTEQTTSKEEEIVTVEEEQTDDKTSEINTKDEVGQEEQQKEENKQEQQTDNVEEKEETEQEEDKTSQEIKREVKRNGNYIQKIYDYIIANDKSEYSIVEDSSVVNTTSGFTFSVFNMSGYIGNYSVYRIYAQDYYVNGEYVETRCYID